MIPLQVPSPSRNRSWLLRSGAAVAFAVAVFGVSSPVHAYPELPGKVDAALGLTCVPPCTICHLMTTPQLGDSAAQPFADNVREAAMSLAGGPINEEFLQNNLASILQRIDQAPCPNTDDKSCETMPCVKCNADGTGEGDIAEIKAGQNPNNAGTLPCVEYGCGAHVAPERGSRPLDGTAALFALGAALVLARRFRR